MRQSLSDDKEEDTDDNVEEKDVTELEREEMEEETALRNNVVACVL